MSEKASGSNAPPPLALWGRGEGVPGASLLSHVRALRRDATPAEKKLWQGLRRHQVGAFKFRRQVPFRNYMLDFVCFERRLVVGIDGSQHAQSSTDPVRAQFLAEEGFKTLRYWNNDVFQRPTEVLEDILAKLVER